ARAFIHVEACALAGIDGTNPVDAVIETAAPEEGDVAFLHAALFWHLIVSPGTEAIELLDRDQVDHTGYRVGAVQGGATVEYDFHTRDCDVRQHGGNGVVDGAHPVHQGQGAVFSQSPKVEGGPDTALVSRRGGKNVLYGIGVLGKGQVTDVVCHTGSAGGVEILLADRGNGRVLREGAIANVGTGYYHFLHICFLLILGEQDARGAQGHCDGGTNHRAQVLLLASSLWILHGSLFSSLL